MHILDIPVTDELLERWREHLCPDPIPLFLTAEEAAAFQWPTRPRSEGGWTAAQGDSMTLWAVDKAADQVVWLSCAQWETLAPKTQQQLLRLQAAHGRGNIPSGKQFEGVLPVPSGGRFLWSPDQLTPAVLARIVEKDGVPCRRAEVPQEVWQTARSLLPRVRELAGTFSASGVGNCFGAVMGAAGIVGAESEWRQREPFEQFLQERTVRGGKDDEAGTVLVWSSERGVEHAAVTLGGGWGFQKAAQTWWTPRVVLPVQDIKRSNRVRGWRLERWRLR